MSAKKRETRIIPEKTAARFYAKHLKPYEFLRAKATGKKILEVGCGDGYGAMYLAEAAGEVIAVDYEEEIIVTAQNKYSAANLKFLRMSATDLQFEDNSFDAVCSFQVIEHIPEEELARYLSEIRRVLKKGGEFYLSTLNLAHAMKSPATYEKNPAHCKEFTLPELKELLSRVFSDKSIYGLHLTAKHRVYQRLKRLGIPVKKFYNAISVSDFKITAKKPEKAIDFICVCRKE